MSVEQGVLQQGQLKDVIKNKTVFMWLRELAKSDPSSFVRLSAENRKRLIRVLGQPDDIQKDGKRVAMLWKISNGGLPVWIVADRMGTSFRLEYSGSDVAFANDRKIGSLLTNFLFRILQSLSRTSVPFDRDLSVSG